MLFGAALHHLYEYFIPELRPEYPSLRHLVFFVINLGLAFLMLRRRKHYVPLLLIVSVQQLNGHGRNLLNSWLKGGDALYTDLVVVLLVPVVFALYTYDVFREDINEKSGDNL